MPGGEGDEKAMGVELVILYVLIVALLMTLVIPIHNMADTLVNVLNDKNNSSWIALGTVLYMTIFGYYFYSEGTFWVFAIFFCYITFFFQYY